MLQTYVAATLLAGWLIASFALARCAESRASGVRPSYSWAAIVAAVFVGVAAIVLRAPPAGAVACGIACIGLVAAADSDSRTGYLFDAVTLPAAILTTFAAVAADSTCEAARGVVLLVGTFGSVVLLSNGRLMGLGDVKAMFALGAAFGPLESLVAIFAACISGILAALLAGRLQRGTRLHFGPHLAAGSVFALTTGDYIVRHWMSF
jgi:prepilin signal peptidase PulO-like enzyme (type II secretory pathway)